MATPRTYSFEFKRQVVQEYLAGETLYGLTQQHDIRRNWSASFPVSWPVLDRPFLHVTRFPEIGPRTIRFLLGNWTMRRSPCGGEQAGTYRRIF